MIWFKLSSGGRAFEESLVDINQALRLCEGRQVEVDASVSRV